MRQLARTLAWPVLAQLLSVCTCQSVVVYRTQKDYINGLAAAADQCSEPLMATANMSSKGKANEARLYSGTPWSAARTFSEDGDASLVIDLGRVHNVTAVAAQGPTVTHFTIMYSLSASAADWTLVRSPDGQARVFSSRVRDSANGSDSTDDAVVRHDFARSFVAQWIKVTPIRWSAGQKPEMRVEFFGCSYNSTKAATLHGSTYLWKDLSQAPVASTKDVIRMRIRCWEHSSGVLLFAHGSQGDAVVIQMLEGSVLVNVDLGAGAGGTVAVSAGSMLDDDRFHDVTVSREGRMLMLRVDDIESSGAVKGDFHRLDLDRTMYIGGVPPELANDDILMAYENFTGCIEDVFINSTDVLSEFAAEGAVGQGGCAPARRAPAVVSFTNGRARVSVNAKAENARRINFSMEFRSFEENAVLAFHTLSGDGGFVRLYLEDGRVKLAVAVEGDDAAAVESDPYPDQIFSDGRWHLVQLEMAKDMAVLAVDDDRAETRRLLDVRAGERYVIGGGGFAGCVRNVRVDDKLQAPSDWASDHDSSGAPEAIVIGSCQVVDRCEPNPCEHSGTCKQNAQEFFCECEGTGYGGAVCHTPMHFRSCVDFRQRRQQQTKQASKTEENEPTEAAQRFAETVIDLDGSGPLAPVPARCEFLPDGRDITYVDHLNEAATKVDGFEEKGSFRQNIFYDAPMETMELLINRSRRCAQKLGYDCLRSRLLNTPVGDDELFSPFGYWVSRQNRQMDYWAGSVPGSRKCECGLLGVCFDPDRWCNCDSGHSDWLWDGGEITQKEYLPVRALHFGDTGTPLDKKMGRFTLGPLECDGDALYDDIVTFKKDDAFMTVPVDEDLLLSGSSSDIYLEFRTASSRTMELLHSEDAWEGDYVTVSVLDGESVRLEFKAGAGPQGVTVTTPYRLDDDAWHSVLIERNRKEAMIIVDGTTKGHLTSEWGGAIVLGGDVRVGAEKDGFVGCVRALSLGGAALDLTAQAKATRNAGVGVGCQGKCVSSPCLNGGKCIEAYDSFSCDCQSSPFSGPICAGEIGVSMTSNRIIKYDMFEGSRKSTLNEKIRVGFTTTEPRGFLIGAFSDLSGEFILLRVTRSGQLSLTYDFGGGKREIMADTGGQSLATGIFHDVRVERFDEGRQIMIRVDEHEAEVHDVLPAEAGAQVAPSELRFDDVRYVYVGRNETMLSYEGFKGCISRLQFEEIAPLKLLLAEDPLSNIMSYPEDMMLKEDSCGLEPVTLPPDVDGGGGEARSGSGRGQPRTTSGAIVLGVTLSLLLVLLISLGVFTFKYVSSRHKGEYLTREDDGAVDATDADTAVLQGKTGHHVEKKKEWFL